MYVCLSVCACLSWGVRVCHCTYVYMFDFFCAGKKRRGRPRKIQPAKMDGDMPDKPSQHATPGSSMAPPLLPVQGETTPQGDKDMTAVVMSAETPGDYNSAAQGLLELSNTGQPLPSRLPVCLVEVCVCLCVCMCVCVCV